MLLKVVPTKHLYPNTATFTGWTDKSKKNIGNLKNDLVYFTELWKPAYVRNKAAYDFPKHSRSQ